MAKLLKTGDKRYINAVISDCEDLLVEFQRRLDYLDEYQKSSQIEALLSRIQDVQKRYCS